MHHIQKVFMGMGKNKRCVWEQQGHNLFLRTAIAMSLSVSFPLLQPPLKNFSSHVLAHAYKPSYSGGRDQDDCDSKPALGK
jgi:hypothetical protein